MLTRLWGEMRLRNKKKNLEGKRYLKQLHIRNGKNVFL